MTVLDTPRYHRGGFEGHTGGVGAVHVDAHTLIAATTCAHQVATRYVLRSSQRIFNRALCLFVNKIQFSCRVIHRCIEGGDDSCKDNVIIYDFWKPGTDKRRHK